MYRRARGNVVPMGPGMPIVDWRGMPETPLRISGGSDSVGLEITDCLLYIFRRVITNQNIPLELTPLARRYLRRMQTDEVSLRAISRRWATWFDGLADPTPEQMDEARRLLAFAEERRQKAVAAAADGEGH
jgi:hypothetical protein